MRDYFDSVIRSLVPAATTDRTPRRDRARGRRSTFVPVPQVAVARAR